MGKVFYRQDDVLRECWRLGLIVHAIEPIRSATGERHAWAPEQLHGLAEALLTNLGLQFYWKTGSHPVLECVRVLWAEHQAVLWAGFVPYSLRKRYGIREQAYVMEWDLDSLYDLLKDRGRSIELPTAEYRLQWRDLSFWMEPWQPLEKWWNELQKVLPGGVMLTLIDRYAPEGQSQRRSYTVRLWSVQPAVLDDAVRAVRRKLEALNAHLRSE